LYCEFAETGVNQEFGYTSAADLIDLCQNAATSNPTATVQEQRKLAPLIHNPPSLGLLTSIDLHSNRISSNRSLCFRETDFCAQRRRRRNIPEKFTETLAETKLTPNKSANWAVITGWPGNLLGSRNAWWG
jgi:hypothetical protein